MLGDWLEGSDWINALVQASIASTGTADAFINACHVTKRPDTPIMFMMFMMLLYVRSLREGNFKLCWECSMQIVPWIFALDPNAPMLHGLSSNQWLLQLTTHHRHH